MGILIGFIIVSLLIMINTIIIGRLILISNEDLNNRITELTIVINNLARKI